MAPDSIRQRIWDYIWKNIHKKFFSIWINEIALVIPDMCGITFVPLVEDLGKLAGQVHGNVSCSSQIIFSDSPVHLQNLFYKPS